MPSKRGSKVSASAKRENEKTIRTLYVNPEAYLFARIDSSLGAGGFRIVLNDASTVTGIPRGLFNRKTLRINVGDVVLVEGCENKSNQHQIVGILSRDDAKEFYGKKMISDAVWRNPDAMDRNDEKDGFEFCEDSDAEVDIDGV